jgi:endonuclease/exonuclease/phosphatase family metal-dependent hydrolase
MPNHRGIVVGVLSWNLFHGRDYPPDPALRTWWSRLLRSTEWNATHAQVNRSLRSEFVGWLADRPWEVALLQEAPPRWHRELIERCQADGRLVLTSRNSFGRLRGVLADWNPDLIASNEGGSNQLLVRRPGRVVEVRRLTLARLPERRRMLWTRLELPGGRPLCAATLHSTANDRSVSARELLHAAAYAVEWAGETPLVLGGDFNLRPREPPEVFGSLAERFGLAAPTSRDAIDHVLARKLEVLDPPRAISPEEREVPGPDGLRIRLSDHAPVVASFGMK